MSTKSEICFEEVIQREIESTLNISVLQENLWYKL